MKEFRVEMLSKGEWRNAKLPFGSKIPIASFDTFAKANQQFVLCVTKWDEFKKNFPIQNKAVQHPHSGA